MRSYLVKTPRLVQKFFYNYSWRIKTDQKEIYLTFDDGPVPDFTPWVLDTLDKFDAKATFFCVGENIQKYPQIYQKIKDGDHSIGNHTFNHLQGWKTPTSKYVKNILKADSYLQNETGTSGQKLFRPPHGRIRPLQAKILRKKGYKIIMWDVLSGDFDQGLNKKECLEHTIKNISNGSIVVFHDSDKSFKNLDYVLPKVLEHFSSRGFNFKAL
ncbi:polysaccharide deacetylase family protein [Lutimonas sp.]|uniref:polysaccharide deacetylase family protein n=1 Tax=Lutimonas sp. TaxID=1872403 RepID=UPI003D9BD3D9